MCMSDQDRESTESAAGADNDAASDPPEQNRVVGPLTDDELKVGGIDCVVAYMRRERSKEAKRQAKHRDKLRGKKRQINVVVADDERSRATVRAAAAAIEDETCHQAVEALLANEDLRPIVVDVATRGELKDILNVARTATSSLLEVVKTVSERPDVELLVKKIVGSRRRRTTVDAALTHPAYVRLGEVVATQSGFCGWLARRILGVRQRNPAPGGSGGKSTPADQ